MSFEVLKDALLDSKCDDVMVWVQNPYYQDEASSVKVDYIEDNNGNMVKHVTILFDGSELMTTCPEFTLTSLLLYRSVMMPEGISFTNSKFIISSKGTDIVLCTEVTVRKPERHSILG